MKAVSKSTKYSLISVATVILLALNLYVTKVFVVLGSPMLFTIALIVELVLLIALLYNLLRALIKPEKIIKSLAVSAWNGLMTNDYVKQLRKSKSPLLIWGRHRFKRNSRYGLPLTITLLISAFFLINFLSLLITVTSKGTLTQIDTRVLNLMPSLRTPFQTTFLRLVTSLANTQTAILLVMVMAAVFWLKHQRLVAALIIVVATGQEIITEVFKILVHRPRPGITLRLIKEDSYSFPSGHVVRATILFGLLAYLIYTSYRSTKARIMTIIVYFLTVFLVAVSRIYLGVHYPTDVWGSFLLGTALLTLIIGAAEIHSRYEIDGGKRLEFSNRSLLVIPGLLLVFAIIASPFLVPIHQLRDTPTYISLQTIDKKTISKLPLYSETLTGSRMEPISFIYVGSENQIVSTFEDHGWYRADKSTISNTLKAIAVGFQGKQYLSAPVTPSYLNYKPENIAFQLPTATHSLRQRHHTRLWRTDYILSDGRQIWVATASFDEGIEFVGAAMLPTHHIDPNIDGERSFIIESLGLHNNLVTVVQPQLGKNASGDSFFTDGKAELAFLK